jgi:potassium-transporting ATPase KdpC subunit
MIIQSIRMLAFITVLTGIGYPLIVTGVAQLVFRDQANGSLIIRNQKIIGSRLIGQPFFEPKYFWSRPSATSPMPYNGASSSGSNLGPTNPALKEAVEARVQALHDAGPTPPGGVPVDLVTASGSGLDPDISVAAAEYQIPRIAKVRNISQDELRALVAARAEGRQLGFLGEARLNVLELNLALDGLK